MTSVGSSWMISGCCSSKLLILQESPPTSASVRYALAPASCSCYSPLCSCGCCSSSFLSGGDRFMCGLPYQVISAEDEEQLFNDPALVIRRRKVGTLGFFVFFKHTRLKPVQTFQLVQKGLHVNLLIHKEEKKHKKTQQCLINSSEIWVHVTAGEK